MSTIDLDILNNLYIFWWMDREGDEPIAKFRLFGRIDMVPHPTNPTKLMQSLQPLGLRGYGFEPTGTFSVTLSSIGQWPEVSVKVFDALAEYARVKHPARVLVGRVAFQDMVPSTDALAPALDIKSLKEHIRDRGL